MTLLAGIGLDAGTWAHVYRLGMRHSRVTALVAAADQDLSAASATRSQNMRIEQTHLVPGGQHATGLLSGTCTHIQCSP